MAVGDDERAGAGRAGGITPVHLVIVAAVGVFLIGLAATVGGAKPAGEGDEEATTQPSVASSPASTAPREAASVEPAPADPASESARAAAQEALLQLPRRDPADPAALGRVDAPVVLIEWSDYRCPFCSAFNEDTLPQLMSYVDEGRLRIEFRDLAVFGEESQFAAVAARAAGEQGKQVEFMHALFAALPNQGHPDVDEALVTRIAQQVGVGDMAKFTADLASQELRNAVLAESFEAQQMGLGSVPAFAIGGQYVAGAQPVEVFRAVIEQELARAGA